MAKILKLHNMSKDNAHLFVGKPNRGTPRSTFDFSHTNSDSMNIGEIKVGTWFETMPKDTIRAGVSENVIASPMQAPSFVRMKHVNKDFYIPETLLWKYHNEFMLQRPDGIFSNSQVAQSIKEKKPWMPPSINFGLWLMPLVAFAKGYFLLRENIIFEDGGMYYYPPSGDAKDFENELFNLGVGTTTSSHSISFVPLNFKAMNIDFSSDAYFTLIDKSSKEYFPNTLRAVFSVNGTYDNPNGDDDDSFVYLRFNDISNYDTYPFPYFRLLSSRHFSEAQYVSWKEKNFLKVADKYTGFGYISKSNSVWVDTPWAPAKTQSLIFNLPDDSPVVTLPLPSDELCEQYGMNKVTLLWYCCNQACKLLDSMGLNCEQLLRGSSPKDIFNFEVNALPFFAYQKVYFDHFASKSVQFGQIDWSYSNGAYFDFVYNNIDSTWPSWSLYDFLLSYDVDGSVLDRYRLRHSDVSSIGFLGSGWTLPLLNLPHNFEDLHDLNFTIFRNTDASGVPFYTCFEPLLGFNLNSSYHVFSNRSGETIRTDFTTYLPKFDLYHGLFHLQYSNFAPDYFTTAQYDPTQGNEQVQVPSTITQLREANALQEFFDANQWTRSIGEWLNAHFDSYSKYVGLTDAEFLGSMETNIQISEQLQTSESTENSELGERAGVAQGINNQGLASFTCGEYGIFISVHYIVMETTYVTGVQKKFFAKNSYLDYPYPEFANLSPEAIDYRELFFPSLSLKDYSSLLGRDELFNASGALPQIQLSGSITSDFTTINVSKQPQTQTNPTNNYSYNRVFGYTPRYSSYKFQFDEIKGDLLHTLNYWSDSRDLWSRPVLGYNFLSYELAFLLSNLNKIFAINNDFLADHFTINQLYNIEVSRSLPVHPTPQK